jgi:SAM-dependent methyltransferase
MLTLDVGCGSNFKGSVNCDLFVRDFLNHRGGGNDVLPIHLIPNFVLCDGTKLPFKDQCFDEVFSSQVIEHLDNPQSFVVELVRVCRVGGLIDIDTAHRLGERCRSFLHPKLGKWFKTHHVSKFNLVWFSHVAPIVGCVIVRSYVLQYAGFPHDCFAIINFPYMFGVVFRKNLIGNTLKGSE